MASVMPFVSVAISILYTPFLLLILCIIFLASIGKSLGVRRLYVNILLKLFEYGRQHIEVSKRVQQLQRSDSSDDEDEEMEPDKPPSAVIKENGLNGLTKTTVIQRAEMLAPSPEWNYKRSGSQERLRTRNPDCLTHEGKVESGGLEFHVDHCLDLVKAGVESIIEDQVTSVFEAEELRSWNLLTRTNVQYEFLTWRLTIIWFMGFVVRYFFLFPLRLLIFVIGVWWLIISTACIGILPEGASKQRVNYAVSIACFNFLSRSISAVISYHGLDWRPDKGGICVANHTSPIDALVLMCDNCYSLIGQRHGGFLGLLQRALARASPHIWFERSETKDRTAVAKRLKEHISDPNNPPILIFPEGTCINNTSVMQFKKGSFEVGGTIYPVAIKYDPRFGDAFWNSSRYGMLHYLLNMMTSWAIVCSVWYLPPMSRGQDESATDFANRVKAAIARRGGLVDLMWDGQLKRMKAKKEWRELQQEEFSKRLKGE